MSRQRPGAAGPPRERRPVAPAGERVRRRVASAGPDVELSDEELLALADEGVDPDEVRRAAADRSDQSQASDHDRDTARDEIEGLAVNQRDEY